MAYRRILAEVFNASNINQGLVEDGQASADCLVLKGC
jgi:endonuclease YncB( thermonuclease family)